MIRVRKVTNWFQLWEFLRFPRRVYADIPHWVPPLTAYTWISMGRLQEPEKAFYLVYRDGQLRARAGFKVHRSHGYEALHFGYFEALPDSAAEVETLIHQGHQLAPHLPMRGPHHFRLEDPYTGLLTHGFDQDPYFLMSYNPAYYIELLEQAGLSKSMDLHTYKFEAHTVRLDLMRSRAKRAESKGVTVQTMKPGALRAQVEQIAEIFNDALSENWGFEPIEGQQLEELMLLARWVLDPDKVFFAYKEERPVGCCIMLGDLNPMLKACNGKINWQLFHKYWTRHRWMNRLRGYALGVRKENRADEVMGALVNGVMGLGQEGQWREVELSWILETNRLMIALAKALGGQHDKTYRILERPGR